uniref:Small ribosomal subunit protein bS6c n=1 Tax=Leptocylindrus danicus TaxID=163516 RepID=A0A023HAV7_9STRA|nr:ribosomal protein S6 [Leptocylindrus danicus]AGH28895.1 ribosomal protein S6 [Leptocylindrus danicus]
MSKNIQYEMMILLNEEFNDTELKSWAFKYAKKLQNLNASEIAVISRGKRELAYAINDCKKGNYIQINFASMPKSIEVFSNKLKFDTNVLRFLILNKD